MQRKIKSFKKFSDLSEIKNMNVFNKKGNFKSNLPPNFYISAARIISEDFEGAKLNKKYTKKQLAKARHDLKEFLLLSSFSNTKIKYVNKKNRKALAEFSGAPSSLKYIPVPVNHETDEIKIKDGKVFRENNWSIGEFFPFPNMEAFAEDPEEETYKLWKQIERKYKKKNFAVFVKAGAREISQGHRQFDSLMEQINRLIYSYMNTFEKWLTGLMVYEFKNQKGGKIAPLKEKNKKRQKSKYAKLKGR